MGKDTYYFSHDYNARNDKKISALVREFKSAGYGIYWCTAEMLHEEGGTMDWDELTISSISKDLNEDFELVKKVVEKCSSTFKLFTLTTDNILTANRVVRNLEKRKEISKVRSDAGRLGANAKQMLANAEQNVAKERKGKEKKESIITEYWFLKYYHSTYDIYKSAFNGQSTTEDYFKQWKEFIDFIYKEKYESIFDCKFLSPHSFADLVKNKSFTKQVWGEILKKILATGIKPEHDLYFRIPEFMKYGNKEVKVNTVTDSNGKKRLSPNEFI